MPAIIPRACLEASLLRPAFQALDPMTQGGRFEIEAQIFPDAVVRDVLDMPVDPPQRIPRYSANSSGFKNLPFRTESCPTNMALAVSFSSLTFLPIRFVILH